MSPTDSQTLLDGCTALGAYLHELREAQQFDPATLCRRLRQLGVAARPRDLVAWEAGTRLPGSRARAALIAALNGSPTQADMLVLHDLHATSTITEALATGDTAHVNHIISAHQVYGASQARAWLRRRARWRPPGVSAAMPIWLMEELSDALGRLYACSPMLATRLLREALQQLD